MKANENFSDASVQRFHSIRINSMMSPGDAVDLGRPQVRIKGGGKRLQLSLALRSKGAPRDEIHLFKIEIFL